jgi:hypothetical protein
MALYKVCDIILESSVPLPELERVEGKRPDYVFELLAAPPREFISCQWFHQWGISGGETWLAFARVGSDYLLRFPDLADYLVCVQAKEIRCYAEPEISLETIRHLLLDQVIPLVLAKEGKLVLHASAVVTTEGAIAFLGTSGRGKSTLAAYLAMQGLPVLTDDCLLLEQRNEGIVAVPGYAGLRLWQDSISALFEHEPELRQVAHYSDKKRVGGNSGLLSFCTHPVLLAKAYVLATDEGVTGVNEIAMTPLSPRDAFLELVQYTFNMDIGDRERLEQDFEAFSRLSVLPLFYRLTFPRDLSLLPFIHRAIIENLREG